MADGITALMPLTLKDVADAINMHESTVSRVTTNKYLSTPRGIFELKFFFTSGIQTATGEDISNASVKDLILEMVREENPLKPLSDDQIVKQLISKDIKIARRTVAKYRGELNVLPSHLRKQYD